MTRLELTFAIIKPHIIKQPISLKTIQNTILTSNFKIVKSKRHTFTKENAETFYKEHNNKFFYNRLITFMMSGPSDLYILCRQDAIRKWRELMGPTKVFRTQFEAPDTIRGQFGLSDTRNATHGSDNLGSVRKEIAIFFPSFNVDKWYEEEEMYFRQNQLKFLEKEFVHIITVDCDMKSCILNK